MPSTRLIESLPIKSMEAKPTVAIVRGDIQGRYLLLVVRTGPSVHVTIWSYN